MVLTGRFYRNRRKHGGSIVVLVRRIGSFAREKSGGNPFNYGGYKKSAIGV